MFIGKPVCIIGAAAIVGVTLLCAFDDEVSIGNKAKLIVLTTALSAIVASL